MGKLYKSLLIFSIPVLLWIIALLIVDPFGYFNNDVIKSKQKDYIAYNQNFILYDFIKYKKKPTPYILLGDSKIANLDTSKINQLTKKDFFNLGYGYGSLEEMIKTFWYLKEDYPLKEVYVGINFPSYSATSNRDRVTEAIDLSESKLSYLLSSYNNTATALYFKSLVGSTDSSNEVGFLKPTVTKEEFWSQMLVNGDKFYKSYIYPTEYKKELQKIATYCGEKGIRLVFIIPPTHTDLQEKVQKFKLDSLNSLFKKELTLFGEVYDFDYPNPLTSDKNNFNDPFHTNDSVCTLLIQDVFTDARRHCIYSPKAK